HRLRSQVDAILVGVNTVLADDPQLTARIDDQEGRPWERQPLRVVVDSHARVSPRAQLFRGPGQAMVVVTEAAQEAFLDALRAEGTEVLIAPSLRQQV